MTSICHLYNVLWTYKTKKGENSMKKIICKVQTQGVHSFYYIDGDNQYFLFTQDFRKSVKEIFAGGVNINELNNITSKSHAVNRTLDKLPAYIKYIENEYGIEILNKTKNKNKKIKTKYKREKFSWQNIDWNYAV